MNIITLSKSAPIAKICISEKTDTKNQCDKFVALVYAIEKRLDLSSAKETENVEEICSNAFKNAVGVESVVLPKSTKKIKEYAFKSCAGLKVMEYESGLENADFCIESNAFEDCKELDSVYIKCGKLTIEKDAFIGCSRLRSVFLDCNDLNLRQDAFEDSIDATIYGKKINSFNLKSYCAKKNINYVEVN